jgi:hypothetical protein
MHTQPSHEYAQKDCATIVVLASKPYQRRATRVSTFAELPLTLCCQRMPQHTLLYTHQHQHLHTPHHNTGLSMLCMLCQQPLSLPYMCEHAKDLSYSQRKILT